MRTFCGTYEYMSPELLQKKSYDYTVDIWGLGILLYELMHGYSPFRAKKIEDIYSNIKNKRMKCSGRISPEVKDLLTKILKIEPSERLSMEGILDHSWVKRYSKLQRLKELQAQPSKKSSRKPTEEIFKNKDILKSRKNSSKGKENTQNMIR